MIPARRQLIAVLQRTRAREVAARCRVTPSRVSKWRNGITMPNPNARRVLSDCYGIAVDAWKVNRRR